MDNTWIDGHCTDGQPGRQPENIVPLLPIDGNGGIIIKVAQLLQRNCATGWVSLAKISSGFFIWAFCLINLG